jgi:transposase
MFLKSFSKDIKDYKLKKLEALFEHETYKRIPGTNEVATLNRTHQLKISKRKSESEMSREKPKTYTTEFKVSAVKLANESDQPVTKTAEDLGVNPNTLHTWISKYSSPQTNDKTAGTLEPLYEENKRLKKEVLRLTEERDLRTRQQRTLPGNSGEVRLDQRKYQ